MEDLLDYIRRVNARCPRCGYALRGLSGARCPECGKRFTLDELVASRYAPRLHVATGFGFLVSSVFLSATIVLLPVGMVCFGICIWWAAAQGRVGRMEMAARRRMLWISWAPVGIVIVLVVGVVVLT